MAEPCSPLTLGQSAVVQAGAGTGKTHSLVTLCLHLLGGVGRAEPLHPSRLCAVTFTEKAAAELKERLRQRIDRLADLPRIAGAAELEPELWASCAAAGQTLSVAPFRKARRELGLAHIGTLHSLCAQILRRHPAEAGLDPSFALLDEAEARRLLREEIFGTIVEALDGGPLEAASRRLCAELGFSGRGFGRGLPDEMLSLLLSLGESGRSAGLLVEGSQTLDEAAATAVEANARESLRRALSLLEEAARGARGTVAASVPDLVAQFRARIWPALAATEPGALPEVWQELRTLASGLRAGGAATISESRAAARSALDSLITADAQLRSCRLARNLAALSDRARERYEERKRRRAALDFDDLTHRARNLLESDPVARRSEKARLGALLVDEFQDTSRTQLELLGYLAEDRSGEGTSPAGSGRARALPIAAGLLAAVGDRKQSIYDFRGADVASAQAFARRALEDGAELYHLRESRRSRPSLVAFANLLFAKVLEGEGRPFDTPFVPGEDDLVAWRPEGAPGPCAEILHVEGDVDDEASAIASRIAGLLAPEASERIFERGSTGEETGRAVRGGDIAILLRAITHAEAFRRALLARHVPHLLLKGRGFLETREILDLVALLRLALEPDDAASLATVLRSPAGPVSDDGLVLLARGPRPGREAAARAGRSLGASALEDPEAIALLAPDDAEAAQRTARILALLHREADRLGPAALLEAALTETDYLARAAGGLFGEQAAANVDKLSRLARAHELRGGGLRSFLAHLDALEEDGSEGEAPVVEERDVHALRVLTIHAAKGLEFPIVFVPECGQPSRPLQQGVILDQDLGLALRVRGADGKPSWGTEGAKVLARKQEREEAQGRRLLYVAATRARDRVIFSGRVPRGDRRGRTGRPTWLSLLDAAAASPEAGSLVRIVDAALLPRPPLPAGRALFASEEDLAAAAATAGESPPAAADALARAVRVPAAFGTLILPVTQMADALACPERYRLLHEVGLAEHPSTLDLDEAGPASAAAGGTLAHRVLELFPLGKQAPARDLVRSLVAREGEDPDRHPEVVDPCVAFLESPLGRKLSAADGRHLYREHPFALALEPRAAADAGPAVVLRGQLDALLLEDEAATVIDYKLARKGDAHRYAGQLDAYALAADAIVGGVLRVRTGLVFLRSAGAPFVARPEVDAAGLAGTRERLLGAARAIALGRRGEGWKKASPERCRALRCGFFGRCYPDEREAGRGGARAAPLRPE